MPTRALLSVPPVAPTPPLAAVPQTVPLQGRHRQLRGTRLGRQRHGRGTVDQPVPSPRVQPPKFIPCRRGGVRARELGQLAVQDSVQHAQIPDESLPPSRSGPGLSQPADSRGALDGDPQHHAKPRGRNVCLDRRLPGGPERLERRRPLRSLGRGGASWPATSGAAACTGPVHAGAALGRASATCRPRAAAGRPRKPGRPGRGVQPVSRERRRPVS